jgi:hypothetical protein
MLLDFLLEELWVTRSIEDSSRLAAICCLVAMALFEGTPVDDTAGGTERGCAFLMVGLAYLE